MLSLLCSVVRDGINSLKERWYGKLINVGNDFEEKIISDAWHCPTNFRAQVGTPAVLYLSRNPRSWQEEALMYRT